MRRVEAAGAGAARAWTRGWLWVVALCGAAVLGPPRGGVCAKPNPSELSHSNHTNNWAVIVDTSRFWYNYRHSANALTLYRTVKRLGIPDSHIILMLGDDMACNARNAYPGEIFNNANKRLNLYGDAIEVDYRGPEVTVESFLRVLLGRHPPETPRAKRLLSDASSNVLLFLTGHGGEEFLKFQDAEEILSRDIADAVAQMHLKGRFNELLFIAETCQAASLFQDLYSPGVIGLASSATGESSYSHHVDSDVGLSVIDRFSYHMVEFFERLTVEGASQATLGQLFNSFTFGKLHSTAVLDTRLFTRTTADQVPLTDFFGSVMKVELLEEVYNWGTEGESAFPDPLPSENAEVADASSAFRFPEGRAGCGRDEGSLAAEGGSMRRLSRHIGDSNTGSTAAAANVSLIVSMSNLKLLVGVASTGFAVVASSAFTRNLLL